MKPRVLSAGRLYCDLVFADAPRLPSPGTEVFAPSLSLHAGGGAFITAATLSALGHEVAQISTLPAAPFDAPVRAEMTRHHVDATACQPASAASDPQITVAIASGEDRAFLTRADGDAIPSLASVDWRGYDHLHIGELRSLEEHPELLTQARAAGLSVSLDCGWQDRFDPKAAALIAGVDMFLPNEAEARALSALGVPESCAVLTVVKCGRAGARALRAGQWTHAPATAAKVRDATGAGDAFNAGFLSGWLSGASLDICLRQGNACGANAVQAPGGVGGLSMLAASREAASLSS